MQQHRWISAVHRCLTISGFSCTQAQCREDCLPFFTAFRCSSIIQQALGRAKTPMDFSSAQVPDCFRFFVHTGTVQRRLPAFFTAFGCSSIIQQALGRAKTQVDFSSAQVPDWFRFSRQTGTATYIRLLVVQKYRWITTVLRCLTGSGF